ncbi:hypothetical protein Taro_032799 [Colocasia esculenta]|uniref:Uncharacterized protein n=1 Tax=Colocasia esculenta TaxID=4460 RepID=A0A843VTL6_COLES|nr:hypothetical protein [Colocasia esculenta]
MTKQDKDASGFLLSALATHYCNDPTSRTPARDPEGRAAIHGSEDPEGAYLEDLQKGHSQLTVQALTLTTHTGGNARRTSCHHDRPTTNSYDSESLPEESRGVSLANKAQYSTTKQWNKVMPRRTTRVGPNTTPAELAESNTMRKQHLGTHLLRQRSSRNAGVTT